MRGRGTAKCQLSRRFVAISFFSLRVHDTGARYSSRFRSPHCVCARCGGAVLRSASSHAASSQCRSSHCVCTTQGRGTAKCQLPPLRRDIALLTACARYGPSGTRYCKVSAHALLRRNVAPLAACGRSYTGTWYCKVSAPAPSSQFRSPHCVWAICVRSVVNPGHRAVISEQSAVASARGGVS